MHIIVLNINKIKLLFSPPNYGIIPSRVPSYVGYLF